MDNSFGKFIQWIKLREWKKNFNWFIRGVKTICNMIVELIRWIFVPVTLITLVVVMIIAFAKFFYINEQVLSILNQIKIDPDSSWYSKDGMKYLTKMETLKNYLFDSNVLTFMVTLIIVFLGSILLNIENRANKHIKKYEKTIRQHEAERNAMFLYTRIHILLVFFENNNYYRLAKETKELLKEFHDDKYQKITKEWKINFNDIIHYKMLHKLKIDIKCDKLNEKDIEDSIEALIKLQNEILKLREV